MAIQKTYTKKDMEAYKQFAGTLNDYDMERKSPERHKIILNDIQGIICDTMATTRENIQKKSRKPEYSFPRSVVHYFAYYYTSLSGGYIMAEIGRLDRTGIYNSLKVVENRYDTEKKFRVQIDEIHTKLQNMGYNRIYFRGDRRERN